MFKKIKDFFRKLQLTAHILKQVPTFQVFVDKTILDVESKYVNEEGSKKMAIVVQAVLIKFNVPEDISAEASVKISEATMKFVQSRFDEMKKQGVV